MPQDRERLHWRTRRGQAQKIFGVNGRNAGRHRCGSRPACAELNAKARDPCAAACQPIASA